MISFEDFAKVELRVGTVIEAEPLPESEKLLKLKVDLGEDPSTSSGRDIRQILAGIKQYYKPASLVGKQIIVVANLEPKKMMGLASNGMLLAVEGEKPVILRPIKKVPAGSKIH